MVQSVAAQMIKPGAVGWTSTTAEAQAAAKADDRTAGRMPTGEGAGGGFLDFLATLIDVVNPLQHIPVVSSIYRKLTGDEISGPARIAGGTLYGGPIGGALAVADVAYAQESGGYAGDTVIAALIDKPAPAHTDTPDTAPDSGVMLASATTTHPQPSYFHPASLSVPTPTSARTASGETAMPRDSDTPVIRQPTVEQTAATFRPSQGDAHSTRPQDHVLTAQMLAGSPAFLPEAPAEPRTGLPPELMAMKMQEALDKYAAMKVRGL